MSTRATYCFDNDRVKTTVYIHHDGYPSGAAVYFYETLMKSSKGSFGTQFIRANPNAEITRSHDQHADTEFQYDISGSGPSAQIVAYKLYPQKHCIFSGSVHEFVTQHNDMIENFKPFKQVTLKYCNPQAMNETLAEQRLNHPISHLTAWRGRFEDGANWSSCMEELRELLEQFPAISTSVPEWLLNYKPTLKVS
jgi:hypothetical protein